MPFNLQIPSLETFSILHWILRLTSFRLSVCQQEEPLDNLILPSTSLLLMNDRTIEPMTNKKEFLHHKHYILYPCNNFGLLNWIKINNFNPNSILLCDRIFLLIRQYYIFIDMIVYQFN